MACKPQDGAPYIYITYSTSGDFKVGTYKIPPECPFGSNITTISSPEDLMKNLPKAMANIGKAMGGGGFPTDSTTFRINIQLKLSELYVNLLFHMLSAAASVSTRIES